MSKFNFKRVLYGLEAAKKSAAKDMINAVVKNSLDAFKQQGYNGQPWREVQRRIPGYPAYEYPKTKDLSRRTKPILIMTGRLRRAVANLAHSSRISYSKYDFKVRMMIDESKVPYAGYINNGTENMVARPFMGNTVALRRILKDTLTKNLNRAIKT